MNTNVSNKNVYSVPEVKAWLVILPVLVPLIALTNVVLLRVIVNLS